MTTQADYTPEEWTALVRSPFVAAMAITLADPGGPIEIAKETTAALRTVTEPVADQPELLAAVKAEALAGVQARQNPLADFKPRGADAPQQVVEELRAVNAILTAKAAPDEAAAFRTWLTHAAQEAAEAAKEGGFFGVGAVQISGREQHMLDELAKVLAP